MADPQNESVQERALRLLKAIKAKTENSRQPVFLSELVDDLKMGEAEAQAAFRYLADKRWVETFNIPYRGRINAAGHDVIAAVERNASKNDTATIGKTADAGTPGREAAMEWDVFVSHASEDKEGFVRPLAERLRRRGLRVWFDEFTLKLGDRLRRSIDHGLAKSSYGIVIISPIFLQKDWPQKELDGLVAREIGGIEVILPVWHNIGADQIRTYSPTLADRLAVSSAKGLDHVTDQLMRAIVHRQATPVQHNALSTAGPSPTKPPQSATDSQRVSRASAQSDLVAFGPDVICTGELRGIDASWWSLHVTDFVIGDLNRLVSFIDRFPKAPRGDRYVLVNTLGDGRVLTGAPGLAKADTGYLVRCPVASSFPRIDAQQLGSQWHISPDTNDLHVEKGQIARVSGVEALLQHIRSCLSLQRGEMMFHRDFGVRLAEYFEAFGNSPWLERLFKLEAIRQSAIPYYDDVTKREHTPLQCVNHVLNVEFLAAAPENQLFPIRVDFDVNGIGRWQREISIFLPSTATLEQIHERQKSFIPLH